MIGLMTKNYSNDNLIIEILSSKSQLTIKQIYSLIKDKVDFKINYHGVYERVNFLLKQGLLFKSRNGFSINPNWITSTEQFLGKVKKNYLEKHFFSEEGNIECSLLLKFNSLEEMDQYLKNFESLFLNNLNSSRENIICKHINHTWWPLLYINDEVNTLRVVKERKINYYMVLSEQTPLDKYSLNFYKKEDVHVLAKHSNKAFTYKIIYNDIIFLLIFPSTIMEKVKTMFEKADKFSDLDIKEFYKLLREKQEINVLLVKNKYISNVYKNRIHALFKE